MKENDKPRKGQRHEKNQRLEAVIGDRAILFQEFSGGSALTNRKSDLERGRQWSKTGRPVRSSWRAKRPGHCTGLDAGSSLPRVVEDPGE